MTIWNEKEKICHIEDKRGDTVFDGDTLYDVTQGSIPGRGTHNDSDDHYNGGPMSLDPNSM